MSTSLAPTASTRAMVSRRTVKVDGRGLRPANRPRRLPRRQAALLLADAESGLGTAIRACTPGDRYAAAHLAALRGTAALLATRAQQGRGRLGNAWDLLAKAGPEFAEWAAYFKAGTGKRQLAEAGNTRMVGQLDADQMLRRTGQFLELVRARIGGAG